MNLYSQSLFLVHYVFRPSGPDQILNKTGYMLSNGSVEMSERLKSCCAGCRRLACGWRHRGSQRPRRVLLWMTSEQGEQIWIKLNQVCFSSFFLHSLSPAAWGEGIHHLRPWDLVRARRLQEGDQLDVDDGDDDRNDEEEDDHDVGSLILKAAM